MEASQEFLQNVINHIADPIFVKDHDHRWVLLNDAFCNLMGRSREELVGKSDEDFFPTQEAELFWHADERVMKTGIADVHEETVTDGSGKLHLFSTQKSCFQSPNGFRFLVGTMRDITAHREAEIALQQANDQLESRVEERTATLRELINQLQHEIEERRRVEDALRASENQYRALVETANCIILRWDTQGTIKFLNDYGQRFFGYPLHEIVGYSLVGTVVPQTETSGRDLKAMLNNICLHPERYLFNENENIGKDGTRAWISWANRPIFDEQGNLIEILSVGTDATERKRAEEVVRQSEAQLRSQAEALQKTVQELRQAQTHLVQSEKMSSLGQLVAGVAHEINNPVNFIHGNLTYARQYAQNLLELLKLYQLEYPFPKTVVQQKIDEIDLDFLSEDLPKLLASMKIGAERIREIVHSLRIFSRLDEAEFKAVDLHQGIDSTLMILQNRLKARPDYPEIKVIKEYGQLPLVECFAGQLNQVFMNILSNAIDALEEDIRSRKTTACQLIIPQIHIYTEVRGDRVAIQISDNGPGISEAVQERLFDPFFTTKPVGKGTGMGMSISYQVVTEKHNGSLSCYSKPGDGAKFMIEIPIRQSDRTTGRKG